MGLSLGPGQKLSWGYLGLRTRFNLHLGPDPGLGLESHWGGGVVFGDCLTGSLTGGPALSVPSIPGSIAHLTGA